MSSKPKISIDENGELETSLKRIERMDERIIIVPFDQLIKLKIEDIQGIEEIAVPDATTAKKKEFKGLRKYKELSVFLTLEKNGKVEVDCYISTPTDMENYGLSDIYLVLLQRFFEADKKETIGLPAIVPFKKIQKKI